MTPDQEYEFYAKPEYQQPVGPARRRRRRALSDPVPVRLPADVLDQAPAADADDRSLSSWIRRALEHELRHCA